MATGADAAVCPVRNNPDVVQSAPYTACQEATGVDFQAKGKTPLDAKAFCSNANCYILWKQVSDLGALDCFKRYNVSSGYKLRKPGSSKKCFKANGILTVVVTAADEVSDANDTSADDEDDATDTPVIPSSTAASAVVAAPEPALTTSVPNSGLVNSPTSSVTSTTTGSADHKSSVAVVAGSSAGGVVLVVIIIALIAMRRRKSRKASEPKDLVTPDGVGLYVQTTQSSRSSRALDNSFAVLGEGVSTMDASKPSSRPAFWEDDVINAVRIPYEKVTKNKLISRGGYGEVFRGLYRNRVVAIKCLLPERRNDMRQIENFLEEIKLMVALEHEHIVRFIGVAWDSLNELCAVTEYMPRGDLRAFLALYEASENAPPSGFNPDKIKIALHVANALTYMHSLQPVVLHRDLKSRNILLDAALNAKLTDFGVSREQVDNTMTIGIGSSLWMAPEVMTGGYYDEKADVFSFGVVLSELDTHRLPYSHAVESGRGRKLPDTVIVQMVATSRISVQFTNEEDSIIAKLARRCVSLNPAARPTAAELQHMLHQVHRGGITSL